MALKMNSKKNVIKKKKKRLTRYSFIVKIQSFLMLIYPCLIYCKKIKLSFFFIYILNIFSNETSLKLIFRYLN